MASVTSFDGHSISVHCVFSTASLIVRPLIHIQLPGAWMSDAPNPQVPPSLQFEHAEMTGASQGPAHCTACGARLLDSYYLVGDKPVCSNCHAAVLAHVAGGSGAGRFFKALGAGIAAAILGTIIYFAVLALTGYEIGLIAVLVGGIVGAAVRWGCNRRGGLTYQLMAIFLTYSSIVSSYLPLIVRELASDRAHTQTTKASDSTNDSDGISNRKAAAGNRKDLSDDQSPKTLPELLLLLAGAGAALFAITLVAPILGAKDNIIGLIIIAFALMQAWRMNKRSQFNISGPHRLQGAAPGASQTYT
jgi:hypothetical protein